MGIKEMINPAGGLHHHINAWRYSQKYWSDFKVKLNEFLMGWSPQSSKLLIVGASGGYNLSEEFLQKFESIQVIDPDPLSKFLFGLRFKLKVSWDTNHYSINNIKSFFFNLQKYEGHSLLFTNFLGQIPHLKNENFSRNKFKEQLQCHLKSGSWCSFHDLYSLSSPIEPLANLESIQTHCSILGQLQDALKGQYTINDHETADLLPESEAQKIFLWERKPNFIHIIEARLHN